MDAFTKVVDLIGPETWFLFETFDLDRSWLYLSPELWPSSESYQKAKTFVCNLKDAAERNVKLYADYSAFLTENEGQRASLLQAIERHRREYPDFRKSTLKQ